MYSDDELASAVEAGILTKEAVAAFRTHVEALNRRAAADEEYFKLISGFNDLFVVIACLLLLASVEWIGAALAPWLGAIAMSATSWGLGEFFIRKRHMALPAIVLLLTFVGGTFAATLLLLEGTTETIAVGSALAAVAAWLHWLRFKVPVTVAAGAAAATAFVFFLLFSAIPEARSWSSTISLTAGIAVFALAMWWDASDAARQTRRADVAFWLHLLAAPLVVHPIFAWLGALDSETTWVQAFAVMATYLAIAILSLCIDRRALMVSALGYVLYAFSVLLGQYGFINLNFAFTALLIGSALLALSIFWGTSRALMLKQLPISIRQRLAPLH